jgi:hypothetical protein
MNVVSPTPTPWIIDPSCKGFREQLNRSSFQFNHQLAGHPLFKLSRLARLAETKLATGRQDEFIHFDGSGTPKSGLDRAPRERVSDAIEHVDRPGSWIKITSAQDSDPEYRLLCDQILEEIDERTGLPLRKEITWVGATIFIGSPNSITPYHIDHETNFLFLITGEKEVNLFDHSVLTQEEIEGFYIGASNAARYWDEYQARASVYRMKPGQGVHHPSLAPHWVRNGREPTVALSVGFGHTTIDVKARVYQVNHYLRKLGIRPTPIGNVAWKDQLKIAALGALSTRHPKTDREVYASAIDRIRTPARFLKKWVAQIRGESV